VDRPILRRRVAHSGREDGREENACEEDAREEEVCSEEGADAPTLTAQVVRSDGACAHAVRNAGNCEAQHLHEPASRSTRRSTVAVSGRVGAS
jgi:hypothetical protein